MKRKSSLNLPARPLQPVSRLTPHNIDPEQVLRARDSLRLLKSKIAKAQQSRDGSIYDVQKSFSKQKYDKMAHMGQRNLDAKVPQSATDTGRRPTNPPIQPRPGSTGKQKQSAAGSKSPPMAPSPPLPASSGPVNSYLQIPICQLKKEPPELPDLYAKIQLIECGMGCGRKFSAQNLKKHMKICGREVERRVFNSEEQRRIQQQFKSKPMKPAKGKAAEEKAERAAKQAETKKQKWKAQSQALRLAMMSHRGKLTDQQQKQFNTVQQQANDMIKCKFCCRSFNEKAAEKHIPFCQKKAKVDSIKRR